MESADEARFKSIIADSIILLCNKGMLSKSVSKVEGLLGITLEDQRVILINVNEVFATHISTSSSQVKRPRSTAHSATVATPPEPAVKKRKVQLHARREVVKPVFEHKNPVSPCEELPIEDWPPVEQPDLCGEMDHVAQPVKLFQNTNVVKLKEEASQAPTPPLRKPPSRRNPETRMSFKSTIWQFFTYIEGQGAQCHFCSRCIITCGNTSNMWNHLQRCLRHDPLNLQLVLQAKTDGCVQKKWVVTPSSNGADNGLEVADIKTECFDDSVVCIKTYQTSQDSSFHIIKVGSPPEPKEEKLPEGLNNTQTSDDELIVRTFEERLTTDIEHSNRDDT